MSCIFSNNLIVGSLYLQCRIDERGCKLNFDLKKLRKESVEESFFGEEN